MQMENGVTQLEGDEYSKCRDITLLDVLTSRYKVRGLLTCQRMLDVAEPRNSLQLKASD